MFAAIYADVRAYLRFYHSNLHLLSPWCQMKKMLILLVAAASCLSRIQTVTAQTKHFVLDTLTFYDASRARTIPVALYRPPNRHCPLVVLSHGYGQNKGGDYLAYSYLTEYLAGRGYFVASIQHELPSDELLPTTGNLQVLRRPFWERGADNIRFVIEALRRIHPEVDFSEICLIGHSNGGDMTALFAHKYPAGASKIITLDNRRMALPRTLSPRVCSLRSSDQLPDEGVLPTPEEQRRFEMRIVRLSGVTHNEMDDNATKTQRKVLRRHIVDFLKK